MTKNLPKISLITPTLNQSKFIKQTIISVLSQKYPNLEYIVIDGGSTDDTVKILKSFGNKLKWISEKDKGQSSAINKGLKIATGEMLGYLNSDDYLEKNALWKVSEYFSDNKDAYWLTGKCRIVDQKGKEVRKFITIYKNIFLKYLRFKPIFYIIQFISQPATFWRKDVVKKIGVFDESLYYSMDYEYWLRIWKTYKLHFLNDYLACYRIHSFSKTVTNPKGQFDEEYSVVSRYTRNPLIGLLHRFHIKLALFVYQLLKRRN
ncbi:glycosyltransferase [Candidatus Gottesmanbacteria bacterium]|nr:glycosyltransferase [Candidatus Gottesmanbacteria bacterium]